MIFGKFFLDKSEQKVIKAQLVSSEGLNSVPKEITSSGWKSKRKQKEIQLKTEYTHTPPQYWTCYCGAELHPEDGKVLREHTTCDYFYSHKTYRKR